MRSRRARTGNQQRPSATGSTPTYKPIRAKAPSWLAVAFGVVSAAVGYYMSWVEQLPTGATMVVVASVFLVTGLLKMLRRSSV